MKKVLAIFMMVLCTQGFAYNTYKVRDYTCAELKNFLATQGAVNLIYRTGGNRTHFYSRKDACRGRRSDRWEPRTVSVFSGDRKLCWMRYRCDRHDRDRD
jgi:hypothetical protein